MRLPWVSHGCPAGRLWDSRESPMDFYESPVGLIGLHESPWVVRGCQWVGHRSPMDDHRLDDHGLIGIAYGCPWDAHGLRCISHGSP